MYDQKVLNISPFRFFGPIFFDLFDDSARFFLLISLKLVVKKESVILPSQNGRNKLLKGTNSCTCIF